AVIIVEIVVRKIAEKSQHLNKVLNKEEFELTIYEGSSEIMRSATFGQFIILIVYIPILAFTGIEGKMFKPMALTVIFALAGAFLLSLTYVPMISALFLKHRISEKETFADKLMRKMKSGYLPSLNWSLKHQKFIVVASVAMLAFSVYLFTKLGGEFIPVLNEGDYAIECRMLPGTSLSQSLYIAKKIEKTLLDSFPNEIKKCVSKIGTSEIPTDPMPFEAFDEIVTLKDRDQWKRASTKEELDVLLERTLSNFPGIIFSIQQPIQMRFNELMTSAKTEVVLKLFGNDLHQLSETANEIATVIGKIQGASDVQVQKVEGLPQIQIEYLREQLASYGITVRQVNDVIQTAFAGKAAKLIFEQEKSFELVVKFDDAHRKDMEDLKELMLENPYGEKIPLKELATIKIVNGPAEISRENAKRRINIGFNSRGRDVESIVDDLKKQVEKNVKLPVGYTLVYGGEFENLAHAKQRLSIVLPIALVVIFLLLYFSFGSFKQGLLILSAVPLAAAGGVFSLWLRDMPFSISAGIGFIALFGVAVLNGIVLISYLNQLEKEGFTDLDQRIHKGLGDRFRPVVMTALVASLGFLPMAISHGPGAEIQRPLATVVVGGLISATLLKLIVLPVLYAMTQKKIKGKIIGLLIFGFFSSQVFAQNSNEPLLVEKLPPLPTCVDAAVKNYPLMPASELEIAQQKALKGTAFNPLPLDLLFQVPYNKDFRPAVLQAFDFPMVYVSQGQVYRQQVRIAESEKNINLVRLVKTVKDIYQNFLFTAVIRNEWKYQDSIYSLFTKNAELKYKAGDISYLDKLNAESNSAMVKNNLAVAESEFSNAKSQLENLTGLRFLLSSENLKIEKNNFQSAGIDSSNIENNPSVNYFKETIKLHERNLSNARWKLVPGFTIGYFNQVEPDVPVAYNLQYGLRIPIFFWTYTSKIKYEKLGVKHEQLKMELAKRN
ncbi:MAG: CusA/CzcA family heavy metal efflux RND transporter, partial [Bacteroidia bacterium]